MPLSPAPIFPGTSPLPSPGQRPPDRRAFRIAALVALPLLIGLLALGQVSLTRLVYLAPGIEAQANSSNSGASGAPFQGFVYSWTKQDAVAHPDGGYSSPASLKNLQLQSQTFHMNAAIIPIVADMPLRSGPTLNWKATDAGNKDTLPDAEYEAAIKNALKANIVPILQLVVHQQDTRVSGADESSELVGKAWYNQPVAATFGLPGAGTPSVGATERAWFDSYAEFAVHYAQLSEKYRLPYFIIGDRLSSVTTDTDHTSKAKDPAGIDNGVGGENLNCTLGRRDCEWRHVVNAIRVKGYNTYQHKPAPNGGASYTGKLIYGASWGPQGASEFEKITWWDAMSYIGIAAYFPLTQNQAGVSVDTLKSIWRGQGSEPTEQDNIVGRIQKVSDTYTRTVLFTGAGYESVPGSNANPGLMVVSETSDVDNNEQQSDMQALVQTFDSQSWWVGVFWASEQPLTPHSAQTNWKFSTAWANDTLDSSKVGGQWLAHYYKPRVLPCDCLG